MESINAATTEKVTLNNKIFDLVLNLNTLNNVKGDLAKLQDAARVKQAEREREKESLASVFMARSMPREITNNRNSGALMDCGGS